MQSSSVISLSDQAKQQSKFGRQHQEMPMTQHVESTNSFVVRAASHTSSSKSSVQTDKMSDAKALRQGNQDLSQLSRLSNKKTSIQEGGKYVTMTDIGQAIQHVVPKTQGQTSDNNYQGELDTREQTAHNKLNINVIDFGKSSSARKKNLEYLEPLLNQQVSQHQFLTVTDDCTLQILPGDLKIDPRSAITTKQDKQQLSSQPLNLDQQKLQAKLKVNQQPSLRYVVKEELWSQTTHSKHSNEDLVNFTLTQSNAERKDSVSNQTAVISETVAPMHKFSEVTLKKRKTESVPAAQHNKSKKIKMATARPLEEQLLSPFETDLESRNKSPQLDQFSISGEFAHHLVMENNQKPFELQTITNLHDISTRTEGKQPQWPPDLDRARRIVLTDRSSTKPPQVVGLPNIDICQGSEPRYLNFKISPQTAREMHHHQLKEEKELAREQAEKLAQPKFKKTKKYRSRSKKKKGLIIEDLLARKEDHEENQDTSFIQNVLGKYLHNYDEYKRRQRHQLVSQSIDVGTLSRSVQLPPLMSPVAKPRISLQQELPKFLSQIKQPKKLFEPTHKLSQSIDLSKYQSGSLQKYNLEQKIKTLDEKEIQDHKRFGQAILLQHDQYKQDESDSKIMLTKDFQSEMAYIKKQHNHALSDFNQYFEVMTDMEKSPFVPTHIAKIRRVEAQEAKQQAQQAKIQQKWEQKQQQQIIDAEAQKKTTQLLAHSLSDIQTDSLENRMSVGDLVGDMGASDSEINNINQKELDIELSNFRLTQTATADLSSSPARLQVKKPKTNAQEEDINLDMRLIEANKALEQGDLASYSKIQREIKRYPKGMMSPSVTPKGLKSEGSVGGASVMANDAAQDIDAFRYVLESAADGIEDQDVKSVLDVTMQEILNNRINESATNFDKMVFGKSLTIVKQTNQRIKKASLATLNELIDEYLTSDSNTDISPLLQVYDHLAQHTKTTLPSRAMLQQDQVFFKEAIKKMRVAHKVELGWVKSQALKTAKEYVNQKNHEIQQMVTKQILDMHRQYNKLRTDALFFKSETERLTEKLVGFESTIAELGSYVNSLQTKNIEEERIIKLIDLDSVVCQPILQMKKQTTVLAVQQKEATDSKIRDEHILDYQFEQNSNDDNSISPDQSCECQMKIFARMQNKFFEKVSQYQENAVENNSWSNDGVILPKKPIQTSVERQVMKLLKTGILDLKRNKSQHSSAIKIQELGTPLSMNQKSQGQQSILDSKDSEEEGERTKHDKNIVKANEDPLLMKQFSFFNSYLKVNSEHKVPILKDRVVNYYQGRQVQLEEYAGLLESENRYYRERNAKLHKYNIVCKEKIKELSQRILHHLAHFQEEKKSDLKKQHVRYKKLQESSKAELNRCKQIFSMEVFVLEQVRDKALEDNREKTELLRQFAFVLKTPRLHHEYLERNGVDPFIKKFTQIISENQALKAEMERIGENRRVRKAVSLVKNKCRQDNQTMFANSLPKQVELLIRQRSKFLGKALDEVKLDAKPFKPGREKSLQARRRGDQLSKSMSVDPSTFRLPQEDSFNTSQMVKNESVIGILAYSKDQEGSQAAFLAQKSQSSVSQFAIGQADPSPDFELQNPESQEFSLQQDSSVQQIMGMTNQASLKEFIAETIRKRPDYNSRLEPSLALQNEKRTNDNSQSNFMNGSSGQQTQVQSKTILHQAYLQALSQSSSLREIVKDDYMPGNILARSDANLANTRQNFLNQYEMVNQYQRLNGLPSYKFALSSGLIDSVDTVINNNSESKEWVRLKHVQSQANVKGSPKDPTVAIETNRIIDQVANREESQTISSVQNEAPQTKKPLQNYQGNRKPFHEQIGMMDWGQQQKQ